MNTHLRHYHLGCGHRLQTDYFLFKSEMNVKVVISKTRPVKKMNKTWIIADSCK